MRWNAGQDVRPEGIRSSELPCLEQIISSDNSAQLRSCSDQTLLSLLRRIARESQDGELKRFYSIRELAACFNRDCNVVVRLPHQLKMERLLISKWGAGFFILPISIDRQLHFRGVIVELVPLSCFYREPRCREIATTVQEELWQHGFVCRRWFYQRADAESRTFVEQLIATKPDSIVWLRPPARVTLLGYRLLNCGIPVVRGVAVAEIINQLLG